MASGAETEDSLDSLAKEAEQLKIKIEEEKRKYHDEECKLQSCSLQIADIAVF